LGPKPCGGEISKGSLLDPPSVQNTGTKFGEVKRLGRPRGMREAEFTYGKSVWVVRPDLARWGGKGKQKQPEKRTKNTL